MSGIADINHRFKHHPPTQESIGIHEKVREADTVLANLLEELLPDSREKSIALTKLEESGFWANAAIARHISAKKSEIYRTPSAEIGYKG